MSDSSARPQPFLSWWAVHATRTDEGRAAQVTPMTKSLVLSVWDRDRLALDRLVGCVEMQLEDLRVSPVASCHYPLVDSRHASRVRNAFLHVRTDLRFTPPPKLAPSPAPEPELVQTQLKVGPSEAKLIVDTSSAPTGPLPQRRSALALPMLRSRVHTNASELCCHVKTPEK